MRCPMGSKIMFILFHANLIISWEKSRPVLLYKNSKEQNAEYSLIQLIDNVKMVGHHFCASHICCFLIF